MKKKTILKVFFSVLTVFLALTCTIASIKTKKVKADTITDLTNTTWVFNDTQSWTTDLNYDINFTSNNTQYTKLYVYYDEALDYYYYNSTVGYFNVYHYSWVNQEYRTIHITGGTAVTNTTLINWLQAHATQQQPTPPGVEITHRYWASYNDIHMTDNEIIGDNNISYTVLLNSYTNDYNEQTLTGLAFTGKLMSINDEHSYIISPTNSDILYQGTTNTIDNPILLEFTTGDYIDEDLYDLMEDTGVWFDDARVYMAGTSFGSIYGFNTGRAYGQGESLEYTNLITTILNSLGSLLSIQIFPNITIALILGLPLLLGVFIIIIKILRG